MFNKRQSPLENKLTNSCQEILEVSAACNHVTLRDEIQKEVSFHFVFQSLSHVRLFVTPWTAAHQASLSFAISQSLLKLMSIESVILSTHHILCCPLLLLPSSTHCFMFNSVRLELIVIWPVGHVQNLVFKQSH